MWLHLQSLVLIQHLKKKNRSEYHLYTFYIHVHCIYMNMAIQSDHTVQTRPTDLFTLSHYPIIPFIIFLSLGSLHWHGPPTVPHSQSAVISGPSHDMYRVLIWHNYGKKLYIGNGRSILQNSRGESGKRLSVYK